MAKSEDFTHALLKKIQAEVAEGFRKMDGRLDQTTEKLGAMAQTLVGVQRDMRDLKREVSGLKD